MSHPENWRWYGYPGHFICADRCLFRLCTEVNGYLVSTVGHLQSGGEMERIGAGKEDFFETYVFNTKPTRCSNSACGCDMPEIHSMELEGSIRSATPGEAQAHHIRLCIEQESKPNGVIPDA